MTALFCRMMAFQRKYYTLSWFLCMAVLAGIGLLYECGLLLRWVGASLLLLMNLITWPLFLVYWEDRKAFWQAHRLWPGMPRLQLLYWMPAAITTLVPLGLLFD